MALYAFDGTWNEDEPGISKDTNVVKFRSAYPENLQRVYMNGPGTRFGWLGKAIGGLTGLGARSRIKQAKKALTERFAAGDTDIDIIGFSRGAALALHFANVVNEERNGATVRFLGLWDVVASFGLPGNPFNIGWTLSLPPNVERCAHAMALDERRGNFPLERVLKPDRSADFRRVEEVWFRGVHSDVGGGNGNTGLSDFALRWMLSKAKEAGAPVSYKGEFKPDPTAKISKNKDLIADPWRVVMPTDFVHESVEPRAGYNELPPDLRRARDDAGLPA